MLIFLNLVFWNSMVLLNIIWNILYMDNSQVSNLWLVYFLYLAMLYTYIILSLLITHNLWFRLFKLTKSILLLGHGLAPRNQLHHIPKQWLKKQVNKRSICNVMYVIMFTKNDFQLQGVWVSRSRTRRNIPNKKTNLSNTDVYFIKKVTNRWTAGSSYKMTRMKSIGKILLLQIFIGNCSMFVLIIWDFTFHW